MPRLIHLSPLEHAAFVAASLLVYVLVTRMGRQRRHPSAALAWVLVIATLPYLALPLFLLFGTRKFVRPARRPRDGGRAGPGTAAAACDDAGLPAGGALPVVPPAWATRLLAGLDLAPPTANAAAAFHADGTRSLLALLALLAHARERIDCCTYVLGDDACGRRVVAALARAARRGVAVHLLLDALGSMRTSRAQLAALRRAGVQVRRFMPLLHNPRRGRTNLRNHRKLVAVDGRWLWSGGRNLADEYFAGRPGEPPWADLSFVVDGPLAAEAHAVFALDWRVAGGGPARRTERPPPAPCRAVGAPARRCSRSSCRAAPTASTTPSTRCCSPPPGRPSGGCSRRRRTSSPTRR